MTGKKAKKITRKEVKEQLDDIVRLFHKAAKSKKAINVLNKMKVINKKTDTLQNLLDYLRVCVKYSLFDLESTRRENAYLRKLLEEMH